MNIVLVAILLVLSPIVSCSSSINDEPKGVSVVMKSDWTGHPLLAQAAELVAERSIEKYWSLIDAIVSDGAPAREVDQMAWLQKRIEMTELDQEGLISLSLATFTASPRCQLFQQHASNILHAYLNRSDLNEAQKPSGTISWFAIVPNAPSPYDGPLFKIEDVDNAVKSVEDHGSAQTKDAFVDRSQFAHLAFPFDHRRQPSTPTTRKVIVFADYTASGFAQLHQKAVRDWVGESASSDSNGASSSQDYQTKHAEYILRPFSPSAFSHGENDNSPIQGHLQGYGVELAFKNVEYRVLDKQSLNMPGMESQESEDVISSSQPLDVNGEPHQNVKNIIVAQYPELKSELEDIVRDWWKLVDSSDGANGETPNLRPKYELSTEQMDSLSLKAMQTIYAAEEPFKAMRDISQNLPSVAHLLARAPVEDESIEQMNHVIHGMDGATNTLMLNGRNVDLDDVDPFTLHQLISDEVFKYKQVSQIGKDAASAYSKGDGAGFSHSEIGDYLSASLNVDMVPKIDLMWDGVTTVVNDLEKHPNYARWPKRVRELLRPSWPGQLTPIAKNLFTILLVLDPEAGSEGVRALDLLLRTVIQNQLPIRLAFLVVTPNPSSRESEWVAACSGKSSSLKCSFNWLLAKLLQASHHNIPDLMNFLTVAAQNPTHLENLRNAWEQAGIAQSFEDAISSNADLIARQYIYLTSAGFSASPENNNNLMLFNGRLLEIDPDNLLANIGQQLTATKQQFQQDIYYGKVDDETDLYQHALGDSSEVFPGYNAQIFANSKSSVSSFFNLAATRFPFSSLPYLAAEDTSTTIKKTTHLVIADWTSGHAKNVLKEWISALNEPTEALRASRLAILPHPSSSKSQDAFQVLEYLIAEAQVDEASKRREGISRLLDILNSYEEIPTIVVCNSVSVELCEGLKEYISGTNSDLMAEKTKLSQEILASASLTGSSLDKVFIVTNGRVIVLNEKTVQNWDQSAWMMLTRLEQTVRASAAAAILGRQLGERMESDTAIGIWEHLVDFDDSEKSEKRAQASLLASLRSDILMKIVSFMNGFSKTTKMAVTVPDHLGKWVRSKKCSENSPAMISGLLYLDPLSKHAQVVSSLLALFMDAVPMELKLVLMPKMGLAELPLKNYFRYVATPTLRFDEVTGRALAEGAHFDFLPKDKVLTLNLIANSQWMVESTEAPFDLDNLLLGQVPSRRMKATYQLQNILVEGSCGDMSAGGQPPRGLKLILGDASQPHLVDTLVMSNLGYFQLKANPGVWYLSLAEGRGSEIYDIYSQTSVVPHSTIFLSEFTSSKVPMRVAKKLGMEKLTLEEESEKNEKASMWSIFGSGNKKSSEQNDEDDKVHVFSVASGHLYERFLRIMMLSVKRNTQSKVKFWIIKNFLSPMFKKSVEALGREFGFEVELVQYSWPQWLRGQVEKQRKIWGYKILFLDVLFPLSLKKVIFIDADQVVRTDLKALMDLDLQGKPYGFTPFCEGEGLKRGETSGFRFWDSGFWKEHLRGRPYHISALFVVDLERLRKFGFADQLRATYDQLSRDPGSLANLDQDLPNYLQHYVPIHSLSPEWLWCETWCSDDSKVNAKTIDLCNNPLTKTPKLDNAIRIIPEWTELDQTTSDWYRRFQQEFATQHLSANSAEQDQQTTIAIEKPPKTDVKDEL
jgi:UDP-glucose:glycoprotein glucosyltransferase